MPADKFIKVKRLRFVDNRMAVPGSVEGWATQASHKIRYYEDRHAYTFVHGGETYQVCQHHVEHAVLEDG